MREPRVEGRHRAQRQLVRAPGAVVARRRRRAGPAPSAEAAGGGANGVPSGEAPARTRAWVLALVTGLARGRRLGDDDGPRRGGGRAPRGEQRRAEG